MSIEVSVSVSVSVVVVAVVDSTVMVLKRVAIAEVNNVEPRDMPLLPLNRQN